MYKSVGTQILLYSCGVHKEALHTSWPVQLNSSLTTNAPDLSCVMLKPAYSLEWNNIPALNQRQTRTVGIWEWGLIWNYLKKLISLKEY